MNTKQKGDMGIGRAIAFFTTKGWTVLLPLTDSQSYDMVADIKGVLNRVQVKYTSFKAPSGNYIVDLRSVSGSSRKAYDVVSKETSDLLFVVTDEFNLLIPSEDVTTKTITIGADYITKYKC